MAPDFIHPDFRMRLLAFLLFWLALPAAMATPFPTSASAATGNPFASNARPAVPPVDQAMPLTVRHENQAWTLRFDLLPNVYLYRPQLKLAVLDADSKELALASTLELPAGVPHEDDVYGKTEVYFQQLVLTLPDSFLPAAARTLRINYQGCLENVLCYPPQQQDIPLATTPTAVPASAHPASAQAGNSLIAVLKTADANRFADWARNQSLWQVLLLFFIGGVLMAFTPCVFPMIPILLGILAGERNPGPARGFTVSLAYVLGMALPYTLMGLLVALSGARLNLQVWLQQPMFVALAALVFVFLSLSMFGVFNLQLPASWQARLGIGSGKGTVPAAATLGAISALVVSPCMTPVLAGALLFVAVQGQWLTGALALFTLSLGMGVPLLIVGAGGGGLLPKAGGFMEDIKRFFGVVLLLMAAWLGGRLLGPNLVLWLYGAILLGYAVMLGVFDGSRRLRQAIALLIAVYALLLMLGAATGSSSLLNPLADHHAHHAGQVVMPGESRFATVPASQLDAALAQASQAGKPVLVDFFADWCTSCKELDDTTLSDPQVLAGLQDFRLLRVDISDINHETMGIMQRFGILGLPCLIFFDRRGNEIPAARVLGYMNSQQWLNHMNSHILGKM